MSEVKIQSDIAREFSVRYPNKRGQLFHISNERNHKVQAFQAAAIGIVNGVSDFLFFEWVPGFGINLLALEVKSPGSRHEVDHIRQQINWGKTLEEQGGSYRLVRSCKEAIDCIEGNLCGLSIEEVEEMIHEIKTKTIKF